MQTEPAKKITAFDGATLTRDHLKSFSAKAKVGNVIKVYPSLMVYGANPKEYYIDTSGHGRYRPDKVLSVHDGALDIHLHYDKDDKEYQVGAVGIDHGKGQVYGRWQIHFTIVGNPKGYKLVLLLWADPEPGFPGGRWTRGEVDFFEGEMDGKVSAYSHNTQGQPNLNAVEMHFPFLTEGEHVAICEWGPGYLIMEVDGQRLVTKNPAAIPSAPMHLVVQGETTADKNAPLPSKDAETHILVDYIARYKRTEVKGA